MNLLWKREVIGETTRMILELDSKTELDLFALNMMNHNDMEYLAPVELVQYNDTNSLQFDITNKDTLANRLSIIVKKKDAIQILNSILNALEETEDYMLSEDKLLKDLNYIFIDKENHCTFLYLPFVQESYGEGLSLLREVVERMLPDFEEKDPYIFNILNAFSRGAVKKVADLKDILRKGNADFETKENPVPVQQSENLQQPVNQQNPVDVKPPEQKKVLNRLPNIPAVPNLSFEIPGKSGSVSMEIPAAKPKKEKKTDKKENKKAEKKAEEKPEKSREAIKWPEVKIFSKKEAKEAGESVSPASAIPINIPNTQKNDMYESYEQTVMMQQPETPEPDEEATMFLNTAGPMAFLERKKTGENIPIDRNKVVIGSGSHADCRITGNKAISREHASISIQDGTCFITDNNSSNGTWVNGICIAPGKAVEIYSETLIKLANEEFIFRRKTR